MRKKIMIMTMVLLTGIVCWYGFVAHAQNASQQQISDLQMQINSDYQKWSSDNSDEIVQNQDILLDHKGWITAKNQLNADETDANTQQTLINAAEIFINGYDESINNQSCNIMGGSCAQNTDCCSDSCTNNSVCQ